MPKASKILFLALLLSLGKAGTLAAQACLGLPAFSTGAVHLTVAAELPEGARGYLAGAGGGRDGGLFANLGGGRVTYEGTSETASLLFVEFGFEYPVGMLRFCPVAGGYLGVGPDDAVARIDVTSRGASVGGALGLPLDFGPLGLTPNVALKYEYLSVKVSEENVGEATSTFDFTTLDAALALLVGGRLSLQPVAHIPLSGDDDEVSYGVYASVSFGWPWR